jgi:hypothetical protein
MKETFAVLSLLIALSGCGSPHKSPKIVDADGKSYYACDGLVWIRENSGLLGGEVTYSATFTDQFGQAHDIRGIKKLSMQDLEPFGCVTQTKQESDGTWTGKTPKGSTVHSKDSEHWTNSDGQPYEADDY